MVWACTRKSTGKKDFKIICDFTIHTVHVIKARRPVIAIIDKKPGISSKVQLLQNSVVLGSARILRKVLES